jgi:hypothetical protein
MADGNNDARAVVHRAVRNGREYIEYADGSSWTRKLDRATGQPVSDWVTVEKPPPADDNDGGTSEKTASIKRCLSVVAEHQAEGEPKHWYLFAHRPNDMGTGPGQVWQVTGDAEFMRYDHSAADVDRMSSPSYAWHQVVSRALADERFARVDEIARAERPPSAPSRAAVTEHCQGWTIRVLVGQIRVPDPPPHTPPPTPLLYS